MFEKKSPGTTVLETFSAAAPKRGTQDPSWVIQRGWSVFRLPRLQELITSSIAELRSEPRPALSCEQGFRPSSPDPTAEALRACCDELREASGIPGAEAVRAQHVKVIRRYMREESLDWSEAFGHALDTYRQAAAQAVERTFARARAA